ncbi:MAG: hypothetical protein WCS01_07240 [bacterium]
MEGTKSQAPSSLRAAARFFTQWGLPVLAVLVLFMILRGSLWQVATLKSMFVFDPQPDDSSMTCEKVFGLDDLTPDQKLILDGDRTRKTSLEGQKAIWEKWPTNIVYLHNYISHLAGSLPYRREGGVTNDQRRANFAQEITRLQSSDPDNARFEYLIAGNLLAEAIEDDSHSITNADGTVKNEWGMKVLDRSKLDEAMVHFRTGLGKPEVRRYTSDMAAERLAIMGEPTSLLKQIAEIGRIAGILLPDLSTWRQLGRTSMAYSRLLIDEGRTEEAKVFLSDCCKFVPQINNDAYTLIDILVVGAVAKIAAEQLPAAYDRLGDTAAARQSGIVTTALAQPIKDWKKKQQELSKDTATEKAIQRHSGILMGLLLPALGEYPTVADLTPSRLLEYTAGERGALGSISIGLVAIGVFCVFLALYYHLASREIQRSAYLLISARDWGRLLLWGVLLPVLCYYVATRCLPWSNRSLNPAIEYPQLITQFVALSLVILAATFTIIRQRVRHGCAELGFLPPSVVPVFWRAWGWCLVGVPVLLAILPESWLDTEDHAWTAYLLGIMGGILGLSGLVYLVYGIVRRQWFRRTHAAYYGSLMRALVPAIAFVVIALNCIAQPWLSRQERHLISIDTVMHIDARGGFTAIESRVVQRLKAEMQQAAAKFPEICPRPGRYTPP